MNKLLLIPLLLLVFAGCATPEPLEVTRVVEITSDPVEVEVTRIVEVEVVEEIEVPVEVTRIVEVVREVEVIVEVTPAPTSIPDEFLSIEGNGNVVTENFEWGACEKAVFSWTAAGQDNFIVRIYKIGIEESRGQVNQIGPAECEYLQALTGGTYYYEINGPAEGWTLQGVCETGFTTSP